MSDTETLLTLVRCWQADRETWMQTGRGPDGTVFPPAWPLAHVETAALIVLLAEQRAKPEPTVAASSVAGTDTA